MKPGVLVVLVAIVLGLAFIPPIAQGFHFGCNSFDHWRMSRLGIEFCK